MVSELWQEETPPCAFFSSLPTLRIAQRCLYGAESLPRNLFARGVFAPEVCKRCQVTRQYENCVTPDWFPHSFVLPIYSDCKCLVHIYDIQSSLADWSYAQMNRDLTESTSFSSNTSETNSRSLLFAKFLCPLSAIGNDFASQDEEVSLLSGFR